jgi:hypothetical protein
VGFVFHLNDLGLVHEVELIADPEVLATMDIVRVRRNQGERRADRASNSTGNQVKGCDDHEDHDL